MATAAESSLTPVEQRLVEHVERGEVLDLAGDDPVDEAAMWTWDNTRTISATVIRDIVRGRLAPDPDPHGLRLRGARIRGRVDLANIASTLAIDLEDCLLDQGISVRQAKLSMLHLVGCRISHSTEPPLDGTQLTADVLILREATVDANSARGGVLLLGAHIGGQVDCSGARLRNDSGPAFDADQLTVGQNAIFRDGFEATGTGHSGAVRLLGARIGGQIDCSGAQLRNDSGPAIDADQLTVEQHMLLRNGFRATGTGELGAVHLLGARIGGQIDCGGAWLYNKSGPALDADQLTVEQNVFLRDGFTATGSGEFGAVRLLGARIGGQLDCTRARLRNDSGPALDMDHLKIDKNALFDDGFDAVGGGDNVVLNFSGAVIGGALIFSPHRLEHRTDPSFRLGVQGLVYAGLPGGVSTEYWLTLLRNGTPMYAAQPYQHLAAALRASGHDREARRVLMAQRRDQIQRRALTGSAERGWARLTGVVLGYGYQPWRALIGLFAVIFAAVVLSVVLGARGALAQPPTTAECTLVQRIGVGLDLGTPLITTGARARCDATNSATGQALAISGWVLRLLAWAFATLFIAGFTGAVRKT